AVTGSMPFASPSKAMERLAAELVAKAKNSLALPAPRPVAADAPKKLPEPSLAVAVVAPVEQPRPVPVARYAAYGLGGLSLVAAGTGVFMGVSATSASDSLSTLDPAYPQKRDQVLSSARNADLAYGAAAALAVGAVVAWWLSPEPQPAADTGAGSRVLVK
ncbi:MAG: hypothetical protein ACYC8T_23320, partial [Myxococcaceae bacterium]